MNPFTHASSAAARLSLDSMRADIARILHEDIEEIGDDDSLIDLGLDSIRAMTLVTRWRDQGADLSFSDLAENPTLGQWWRLASAALMRRDQSQEGGAQ